ncbi:DUF3426 domain-containing protein [Marinobacter zhejiangensis]|uniref:MJ0042 family finger-like domain-containing protein n=1 Tax=Marinobacter zhejiangensis TaxID=488535 RepID=A0A1I4KY24_9GAMM|nr:DUF3426 domain-containing protein [Marinobacter zhejiangensis]SFL83648.1 MJ0042 family finger-like domain-containing protein [Marinobacter zhejiangensis]
MSESSLLTRCPKCKTQFRVTAEQLSVANGKVRCGSCMGVFNALEHRTTATPSKPAAQPEPPKAAEDKPAKPAAAFQQASEDEFVFADNPEEDASERGYKGSNSLFSEDELSDSFLAIEEGSFTGFTADDELESGETNVDESWAEAILDDDHDEPAAAKPTPRPPESPAPARQEPAASREPDFQLASEPEPTPQPEPKATTQPPRRESADELSLQLDTDDRRPQPAFTATGTSQAAAEPQPETSEAPKSSAKPEQFQNLSRDPISVSGKRGYGWIKTTFWTLMVLALLGALGAQVGYYQFDRLSAMPKLRPYYEMACQYAGCELAPLVDIDSIQSRKLVVRTDPENRTALVVDAEIVNRAPFEQPFPAIALTFSNLNGDVVAQSVFPPEAYLAGEAGQLGTMPSEVPVRIAIRIRDPGRDAVNYNIVFRPYSP